MIDVTIMGDKEFVHRMDRGVMAAYDMRPAMNLISDDMRRMFAMMFQSQGRRSGGSWKAISPAWVERKIKKNYDPRILFMKHLLVNSLTKKYSRNAIRVITTSSVEVGSSLPYAERQNRRRPFIRLSKYDTARWDRICEEQLKKAMGWL